MPTTLKILSATTGLASLILGQYRFKPEENLMISNQCSEQCKHEDPDSVSQVLKANEQGRQQQKQERLKNAIALARDQVISKQIESGTPGIVIGVAVDGKTVWKHGFGYADVENRVVAHPDTLMRIASISKSLTITAAARLLETGQLDLDRNVRDYVPAWPESQPKITTRQLVSHMSGIRHFMKKEAIEAEKHKQRKNDETRKTSNTFTHKKSNCGLMTVFSLFLRFHFLFPRVTTLERTIRFPFSAPRDA